MAADDEDLIDDQLLAEIEAARAQTELDDRIEPRAVKAWYDAERNLVFFEMKNGCVFGFPPPKGPHYRLDGATAGQLAQVEPEDDGYGLHWEELDADIAVPGLL